jgi:hypothetical protein
VPNVGADSTDELTSIFRLKLRPPTASGCQIKEAEISVCRRFVGSSQASNALDRAKTLRFVGVIINMWPLTSFTALQKCGRYRINSGQTAPSGLTGSAAFGPTADIRHASGLTKPPPTCELRDPQ